jgi:GntR family transcriptional regulator
VRHSGYHPVNKLLSVTEQRAGAVVGPALRLPEEAFVIRLERLRMQGEEALIYCDDYIPRMVIPGSASDIDWSGSLLDILEGQGSRPVMSSATVTSVTLPSDVAERNDLADFGPALLITEVAFTHAGVPVIYAQDYHKGDAFSFRFLRK